MNPDTDSEWERWGKLDPYYGVITQPKFRRNALTERSRQEFFDSGAAHVDYVLQMLRLHLDPHFSPKSVLDFGCGVGRTLIAFARVSGRVVGLDVSPAMLSEARTNAVAACINNVELRVSDDELSQVQETFDLVHSFIVFQHIDPRRGKAIFARLIARIAPGGMGAVHVLYSKGQYASSLGIPTGVQDLRGFVGAGVKEEPEMQMNAYGATELLFMVQQLGVNRVHIEFTDHGGELGLFLFFRAPGN